MSKQEKHDHERSSANYFSVIVYTAVGVIIVVMLAHGIGTPPPAVLGAIAAIILLFLIIVLVIGLVRNGRRD